MARTNGLSWQRTADAIRAFTRQSASKAPRRAIFCTFDFEVERFEAVVLPALAQRGQQFRTLVAVDAGALQTQLRNLGAARLGRYQVAPVRIPNGGVFHPKLIFLSAGPKQLVGIGSANLTSGGLGGNLELMHFADETSDGGRQLICGAAGFLDRLVGSGVAQIPSSAREFIQTTLAGIPRASNTVFDSLEATLLEQIARSHLMAAQGGGTRSLSIVSPWHSSGASVQGVSPVVLRELKRSFEAKQMAVFTEGQNGQGPALGRGIAVHIRSEAIAPVPSTENRVDENALENATDHRPTRVHAKAYLAESRNGSGTLFFGSANCTQPALMRSISDGGNVELLVASTLDQRAIAAIRADLADLFKPAHVTAATTPERAPIKPAGVILAGTIVGTRHGIHLEIDAPSVRHGKLRISRDENGPPVLVQVSNGCGRVQDPVHIFTLLGENHPSRESGSWAFILWEQLGTSAVPFPVSVPLLAAGGGSPDSALLDLVWEELGVWPAESHDDGTKVETADSETEDKEELDALAATEHQGYLDRIAVLIAILRRRIMKSRAGREYARERMELLRHQVERLDLPPHIKKVLQEHLAITRRKGISRT